MSILRRSRSHGVAPEPVDHFIDHLVANVEHGRFERSLSGLTAFAAFITTA